MIPLLALLSGLLIPGGVTTGVTGNQAADGIVPNCPPGWYGNIDDVTCIKFHHEKKSWEDARAVCQADGGDLVKIKSSLENDFMLSLTNNTNYVFYWIGLRFDKVFHHVGDWDEVTFFKWRFPPQIDNEANPCIQMKCGEHGLGTWSNVPCQSKNYFICEKSPIRLFELSAPRIVPECPRGWSESVHSGTCIKQFDEKKQWLDARAACQAVGGDLLKITNHHMNYFYKRVDRGNYWIGLHDMRFEGTFCWLDETEEAPYFPSKNGSFGSNMALDCVHMTFDGTWKGIWKPEECWVQKSFICERPFQSVVHTTARQLGREFLCPRGWIRSSRSGTCVKLFHDRKSWDDARDSCKAREGDLVKVVDFGMNKLIMDEIATNVNADTDKYWIGLRAEKDINAYRWLDEKGARSSEIAYLGYKGRKARKALRDEAFRWTNKTVPYEIEDGVSNRTRNRVTDATNHWMKYTCILFPPRQGQSKYVYIRDNQRCESLRGMQHFMPGRQNLHVNGCPGLEEVIHEIGHTIGFAHEHSRPDRDEYVDIHISQAGDHNFDKLDELEINTFDLPYDYRSVMHYGPDYMTARDKDFQDKIGPGKRYGLSFLDIKLANLMYKCDEGCKPRPPCPDEGYVGKDCQCYCERDSWLADPIELCNLLRVLQPKFTPWSPHFNRTILNTCVSINTSEVQTGFWTNENCDTANKYICERPQLSTGQISKAYLPSKNEVFCPDSWIASNSSGTCIKFFDPLTKEWLEARNVCKTEGGDLVKIVDKEMNDLIMDKASRPDLLGFWTGLISPKNTTAFYWLDELKEPEYTNWNGGKVSKQLSRNECLLIRTPYWASFPCKGLPQNFICEKSPDYSTVILNKPSNLTSDWEVVSNGLNKPLIINCSADIAGVPPIAKNITSLQIIKVSVLPGVYRVQPIVDLLVQDRILNTSIPYGRKWGVRETEINKGSKHATIELRIDDAKCFDEGYYQCIAKYQDERVRRLYSTDTVQLGHRQWVTVKAPIKNLSMSVELYNANNVYSTTDRVVLTCSVDPMFRNSVFYVDHIEFNPQNGVVLNLSMVPPDLPRAGSSVFVTEIWNTTLSSGPFLETGRKQLENATYWCSAESSPEVLHSERLNITLSEEDEEEPQRAQPMMLKRMVGNVTGRLLIKCNVDVIAKTMRSTNVRSLEIWWRSLRNPEKIEKIAKFHPYESLDDRNYFNKPEGRNWKFYSVGPSPGQTSSRRLSIEWVINDPRCDDNGIYECKMTLVKNGRTKGSRRQENLKLITDTPEDPTRCLHKTLRWFGLDDMYMCHCKENEQCDKIDGSCRTGCESGWFGPGCQYVSLKYRSLYSDEDLTSLKDEDDSTCRLAKKFYIEMESSLYERTWIRLVLRDAGKRFFAIRYKYLETIWQDVKCVTAIVDEKTVDIKCESKQVDIITHLSISSSEASRLCSLYISGGRNLALKQQTQQTSTYHVTFNDQQDWSSDKAVDGSVYDIEAQVNAHARTCARTDVHKPNMWKVTLPPKSRVNGVKILGQLYSLPEDLQTGEEYLGNVHLNFTNNHREVYNDTIDRTKTRATPAISVQEVEIRSPNNLLTLCEVFLYGDTDCPSGFYGRNCQYQCNCVHRSDCFVHSGGCPEGCKFGYTGEDCQTRIEHPLAITNPSKLTNTKEIVEGRQDLQMRIKCSADIVGVPPKITKIEMFQITRTVPGGSGLEIMREFTPSVSIDRRKANTDWIIHPICSDAGVYQCTVTYRDNRKYGERIAHSGQQEVPIRAATRNLMVSVTPYKPNNTYDVDDELTFKCSVEGPMDLVIVWKAGLYNGGELDVLKDDIKVEKPSPLPNDRCGTMIHRSSTTLQKNWGIEADYLVWCSAKYKEEIELASPVKISFRKSKEEGYTSSNLISEKKFEQGKAADPLIIKCNADTVRLPRKFHFIDGLQISRKSLTSTVFKKIAEYFPWHELGERKDYQNDHRWTFDFYGSDWHHTEGIFSRRNLTIEWDIQEPNCSDEGLYECTVYYKDGNVLATHSSQWSWRAVEVYTEQYLSPERRRYQHLEYFALTFVVDGPEDLQLQWNISIGGEDYTEYPITEHIITEKVTGSTLNTCGLTRHKSTLTTQLLKKRRTYLFVCFVKNGERNTPDAKYTIKPADDGVSELSNPAKLTKRPYIQRGKPSLLTCSAKSIGLTAENITDLTFSRYKVAESRKARIFAHYQLTDNFQKKDWLDGQNFSFNFIETPMTIQWTILDPLEDDTAVYECSVDYTKAGHNRSFDGQHFLAVDAPTRNINLDISPSLPKNEYIHGDSITLVCEVEGPPKLLFLWSWREGNTSDFVEWDRPQGIKERSLPIVNDMYGAVTHTSELSLQLTWGTDRDRYTFRCEARFNDLVVQSVNLNLRIFENCLAYKKHCLSEEINQDPKSCTSVEPRCRDVSTANCPTDNTELLELKMLKKINDFDCSVTGKKLLTAMENSSCTIDRLLMKQFGKGLADCNGNFKRKINESNNGEIIANKSFCVAKSEWIECAVKWAETICHKDFGLYAEYHFSSYDEYYFGSMCDKDCHALFMCGNELLGVGLVDTDLDDLIFNDTKNADKLCESAQSCPESFHAIQESCRAESEKIKAKQAMVIRNLACSDMGKKSRSSPFKKGTQQYKKNHDTYKSCHENITRTHRNTSDHCSFVQGRVNCISKVATFERGEPLAMHLVAKYAASDMLGNEQYDCPGGSPRCWWICEDLFQLITTQVALPFSFAWVHEMGENLDKICGNQEIIEACLDIQESLCLDSITQREINNWRQFLDILCSNNGSEPGIAQVLKRHCTIQSGFLNALDAVVQNCHQDMNQRLRIDGSNLSPTDEVCKLLEDTEKCVLEASLRICSNSVESKEFVSKLWTISLADDVAQLKKQCADCLGTYRCIGQLLEQNKSKPYDLVGFLLTKGANDLAQICRELSQCLEQHTPMCTFHPYIHEFKLTLNTVCTSFGWNVIARAHKSRCASSDTYSFLKRKIDHLGDIKAEPRMCSAIVDRLVKVDMISKQNCGTDAASLIAQALSHRYILKYKGHNCSDLTTGCWELQSCLNPFVDFLETNLITLVCQHIKRILECYSNYAQYCRNSTIATKLMTQVDVFTYLCRSDVIADKTKTSYVKSHFRLAEALSSFNDQCVRRFYDSLDRNSSIDTDNDLKPSEDVCRKIEVTERECLTYVSKKSLNSSRTTAENRKMWLDIWLMTIGARYIRARDTCYGINPCPRWSIRSPGRSNCLVAHGKDFYFMAKHKCKTSEEGILKISDIRKFHAVSDFLTNKVFEIYPNHMYWFWTHRKGNLVTQVYPFAAGSPYIALTRLSSNEQRGDKEHFICEEPASCKATCPTGWKMSPAGDLCVKALDSFQSRDNYSAVCEKDGLRLFEVSDSRTVNFVYDLLPIVMFRRFWVKLNSSTLNYFRFIKTKNDIRYKQDTDGSGADVLPSMCTTVTINRPRKLRSDICSDSYGGICAMEPIQCTKGASPKGSTQQTTDNCFLGEYAYQKVCLKFNKVSKTWEDARKHCRRDGGDLVQIAATDHRKRIYIKGLDPLPNIINTFWVGLWRNKDDGLHRWLDNLNTVDPSSYAQSTETDYHQCLNLMRHHYIGILFAPIWQFHHCNSKHSFFCEYSGTLRDPCPRGWLKADKSTCIETLPYSDITWSSASKRCHLFELVATGTRWQFILEHVPFVGEYWIGVTEKNRKTGVECRSLRSSSGVNRTLTLVELSREECHGAKGHGFICERQP